MAIAIKYQFIRILFERNERIKIQLGNLNTLQCKKKNEINKNYN